MPSIVAIVGRPNVGKSTLFNRLTGKRRAIVHDLPGVTRDRREGAASLASLSFHLIDTPGLEDAKDETLEGRMRMQTQKAVEQSNVALFLIDGRVGLTPMDRHFAVWLRTQGKPVIVVINKCEGKKEQARVQEVHSLGFKTIIGISAEHGEGMAELFEALAPFIDDQEPPKSRKKKSEEPPKDRANEALHLAVVGRPNVGKSTLINHWLQEDRMLTGPEAGITRDAISIDWIWREKSIRLVDTAGIRKRSKVQDKIEQLSVADTKNAIAFAEVVIVLLDAENAFEQQDIAIIHDVMEEGRALVIGINKWDTVADAQKTLKALKQKLEHAVPMAKDTPIITLSALTGYHADDLIKHAFEVKKRWNKRINSAELNEWLRECENQHTPPLASDGRRLRLKYITQVGTRPPRFSIFMNKPKELPDSYQRYLLHSLRKTYGFEGVPLRLFLRQNENPYKNKKKK